MSDRSMLAGAGRSGAPDAGLAGREAASAALAELQGQAPAVVIVYTTPRYDLPDLLRGIRSVTGDAILVGATGSGEFLGGQYMGFGAGVAVLALTAGPYSFGAASVAHMRGDLDRAGQELARESRARAGESPHAAVLVLADMLAGDLQELVRGVYRVTGPRIPMVGGLAGDELKFVRTFVFHDDQVVDEGAVALWIGSDHPLRVISRHGWEPIGVPLLVTRSHGIMIEELGGRPAAVAYEEQLGVAPGALTPENFWGTSIVHPFGLLQPDGSTVIRVARAKLETGELRIQGCVPPAGSAVQVMSGDADSLLRVVPAVAQAALEDQPYAGVVLAFSCAARATIFGARTPEEPRLLQEGAGDVPTFGFYCCGEFARTVGVLGTHNATITALAL